MCNILKEVHNNSIFLWKQELAKEIEDHGTVERRWSFQHKQTAERRRS